MLDAAAQSGLPVAVAVGASTMAEIDWAFERMAQHGSPPSLLYHGYQGYPTDLADSHLRYIQTLNAAFGVPVGFQDHISRDDPFCAILPLMAITGGAATIERHFTYAAGLDRYFDHHSAMDPATLAALCPNVPQGGAGPGKRRGEAAQRRRAALSQDDEEIRRRGARPSARSRAGPRRRGFPSRRAAGRPLPSSAI